MTRKNTEGDSWGQLLSDFGIEDKTPQEAVETVEARDSGKVSVSDAEIADESSESKERKSIFSRFPKINFFGAPPEASVDSVIEDVKSPSLGGRAFTDNKLERMPLSQERAERQEKRVAASPGAASPDAFSAVASQIDALASREEAPTTSRERPAKRHVSSMFDDPIPESEEFRALKNIIGEPPRRDEPVRDETRRNAFHEDETDTWQRSRGRPKPQPREDREVHRESYREREEVRGEVRGRGTRYRPPVEVDDLPETNFEPIDDDDMPRTRGGRGRRGSRYAGDNYRDREPIQDDLPQEEWSEVDAALQGRSEPVQRGGRRQRHDKRRGPERPERQERPALDREHSDIEESGIVAVHGNVPSWDEAIGDIIASNIARHKSHSGRGRR